MFGKCHSQTRNNHAPECSSHLVPALWTTQHIPAPTWCGSSRNVCRHAGAPGGQSPDPAPQLGGGRSRHGETELPDQRAAARLGHALRRNGKPPTNTSGKAGRTGERGERRAGEQRLVSAQRPSSGESDDPLLLLFLHFIKRQQSAFADIMNDTVY